MDLWISAPSLDAINLVAQKFPLLWVPATDEEPAHVLPQARFDDGAEWVFVPWGEWLRPTGGTTTDAFGNEVPAMASDGLYYALARWNGDPSGLHFEAVGGTVSVDPETGVMTVVVDDVTLVSPPPPDAPVSF